MAVAPKTEVVAVKLPNGTTVEYTMTNDPDRMPSRRCGRCSLCCKLVPVPSLGKPAFQRCQYIRTSDKGCCSIYGQHPHDCKGWTCMWTVNSMMRLPRPDRAHYVIDVLPDQVRAYQLGEEMDVQVLQIWVDPAFPDSHRDPALRAWLAAHAERTQMAAIVRCGQGDVGLVLIPPSMSETRRWAEVPAVLGKGVGMWSE